MTNFERRIHSAFGSFDRRVVFPHDRKFLIGSAGMLPSRVTKFFGSAGTTPSRKTAVLPVASRYSPFATFPTYRFADNFG